MVCQTERQTHEKNSPVVFSLIFYNPSALSVQRMTVSSGDTNNKNPLIFGCRQINAAP